MKRQTGVLALLSLSSALIAQSLEFGFKAGVPINSNIRFGADESRRYVFGPLLELKLNRSFAVEVAPQYRRLGTGYAFRIPVSLGTPEPGAPGGSPVVGVIIDPKDTVLVSNRGRGHSWEFPLVGKYYFGDADRKWRPFAGTGWALRKIWATFEGQGPIYENGQFTGRMQNFRSTDASETGTGVVVALGAKGRLGPLKVAPEVRYTRWSIASPIQPRRDQVDFSIGFTF